MPGASRLALGLATLVAVVLGGAVAWDVLRSEPPTVGPSADGTEGRAPADRGAPEATSRPVRPTSDAPPEEGAPPEAEAIARDGERLPEIRIGDRVRTARFRPEAFRAGPEVSGEVLLAGIVEGGNVWVRWDAAATRARFLAARFLLPGMTALESGEILVFLEPLPALFRHLGFSCRLEGSVLRLGAEGVYLPDEPPTSERPPDVPPSAPSPR